MDREMMVKREKLMMMVKREKLIEIKNKYDELQEEERQRRSHAWQVSVDKSDELEKEMVEEMRKSISSGKVGEYRVIPLNSKGKKSSMRLDRAWTIHLGEVTCAHNISNFWSEDAYIKAVDKLADIGLSFETKKQAEEYLEKLKAEIRG